jgi:hypothetical protein
VRALLAVEQRYASSQGLYPLDPDRLERALDPLARDGRTLRYEPAADGLGYRLWSVGWDGRDDGGLGPLDLAYERVSATTRAALAR